MGDIVRLSRIVARQHGVFSIAQARGAGFDRSAVHHRIETGIWIRVDDSVYAVVSAPRTWEQTLWTAVLSRDRALLTHWTACRLFGITNVPPHRPTILLPRGSNARSSFARIFESDQFDALTKTTVHRLPVTTMPETVLALARDTKRDEVERVFDEAVVTGRLDLKAMAQIIDREAGRRTPGTPLLRRLTSSRMPGAPSKSSSFLERLLEGILGDPRMPAWTREHEFALDGASARVDVFVPDARLVIEADGRNWHTRWEDFEADRRRDNALAVRGIQVIRFTYQMLTNEPHKCVEQVIAICLVRAA